MPTTASIGDDVHGVGVAEDVAAPGVGHEPLQHGQHESSGAGDDGSQGREAIRPRVLRRRGPGLNGVFTVGVDVDGD
jgi:hypothetical protein